MTGSVKSSSESNESPAAVIDIGTTKLTTTAQVHSIAKRENRKKMGATLVILHVIRVQAFPSGAIDP